MRFVVVELDDGEQEFFDSPIDGFRFAKKKEAERRHSVEYVAIGEFYEEDDGSVYTGQLLRTMLRSVDNINGWLKI
jgi:hypothetical protein